MKKYQVFISSTYKDLQKERWAVLQSLLKMDCMELFPAIEMEQFEYIKQIIDDCDYYVLILGGKYGSIGSEGLSYTEMEYDYACSKEIPIIRLVHENPNGLPSNKRETEPEKLELFQKFRAKVISDRLMRTWKTLPDLEREAVTAYHHATRHLPAIGWVRANRIPKDEVLEDLLEVIKENDSLKRELAKQKNHNNSVEDVLEQEIILSDDNKIKIKLSEIFKASEIYLSNGCGIGRMESIINYNWKKAYTGSVKRSVTFKVINSLLAAELVEMRIIDNRQFYFLTQKGAKASVFLSTKKE